MSLKDKVMLISTKGDCCVSFLDGKEIYLKKDVDEAVAELKEWCRRYRTSNELWGKSQDENLMDFEDKIKEVM